MNAVPAIWSLLSESVKDSLGSNREVVCTTIFLDVNVFLLASYIRQRFSVLYWCEVGGS